METKNWKGNVKFLIKVDNCPFGKYINFCSNEMIIISNDYHLFDSCHEAECLIERIKWTSSDNMYPNRVYDYRVYPFPELTLDNTKI